MIQDIVHDHVREARALRCNVRATTHNTTTAGAGGYDPFTGRKKVRIDPLGHHITFEIQDPDILTWIPYHFYVTWVEVDGVKRLVKNHSVAPNPRLYRPTATEKATELNRHAANPDVIESYKYD